jgi:hypothetical protein
MNLLQQVCMDFQDIQVILDGLFGRWVLNYFLIIIFASPYGSMQHIHFFKIEFLMKSIIYLDFLVINIFNMPKKLQ